MFKLIAACNDDSDNYGGIQAITFLCNLRILKKMGLYYFFLAQDPTGLQITKSYSSTQF